MKILTLAWRSLWRSRRRTLITVSSIALGTAFALFFISMGDGAYRKLIEEAVRMNAGHITVQHPVYADAPAVDLTVASVGVVRESVEGLPYVSHIKPRIVGQAVVSTGRGSAGVGLIGIDPALEQAVSPLARNIVAGRYLKGDDVRGALIGRTLAESLHLKPGKKLVVTTNDKNGELVGEMLRVTGIYFSGMEEADAFLVQVPLDTARRIYRLGPDEATQVGIVLTTPERQKRVLAALRSRLEPHHLAVLPWQEVMSDLADFMAMDMGSNYVFQGIIFFLICFTILNTILMSVLERTREFATLLALGTPPGRLRGQIIVESALIGAIGALSGLALGGAVSGYFMVNGLDFSKLMGEGLSVTGFTVDPVIHNLVTLKLLAWLGGTVFAVTVLIGFYPAAKATHISLPDVLRSR